MDRMLRVRILIVLLCIRLRSSDSSVVDDYD
jgi:hypothetical protein